MEAYLTSKSRLFREHLASPAQAVVNLDDPAAGAIIAAARESGAEILRCTRDPRAEAEIKLLEANVRMSGTRARAEIRGQAIDLEVPLLGDFNLENLLVACGIASALAIDPQTIAAGVAACPQVPGRMETVGEGREGDPTVIVDYAHTPDAVEKLLGALRPLCEGRLITVFGCGGDRDRSKRPLMAQSVARHSDLALATSDNPRTEDPQSILEDVEKGLGALEACDPADLGQRSGCYAVVEDRRKAIEQAMAIARPGDTVVLAGKGHEDYQIVGREKLPFDDRVEARKALARRSSV
jgi:UDP-N-acetylmuramyl-tripeptide synthetase